MFKCKECGKAYNARGSLSHHRKTHLKEKEQKEHIVVSSLLQAPPAAGANQLLQEVVTATMLPPPPQGQVGVQHGVPAVSGIRMPAPAPEQPVFQHVQHLGYTGMLMN